VLSSTRAKSLVGVVVAVAALIGIGVPALEEDSAAPATTSTSATTTAPHAGAGSSPTATSEEAEAIAGVLAAIDSGEPLPYEEDGQTFQNREGLLPSQPIGYYSEYTVETPGSPDRGARRLVIGDGGETYYTDDHYASFTRIDPSDYGQ
jgi:ribonuclease T1